MLLAAGATAANAQSFEVYLSNKCENDVVSDYKLISEGEVFNAGNEVNTDWGQLESSAYLLIKNKTDEPLDVTMDISVAKQELSPEAQDAMGMGYTLCFFNNCSIGAEHTSGTIPGNGQTLGGKGEHVAYAFMFDNEEDIQKFTYDILQNFTVTAADETLHFSVAFKSSGSTGIDGIEAENAEAVYYNLQGMRVNNPEKGQLYIVRKGAKTSKAIY